MGAVRFSRLTNSSIDVVVEKKKTNDGAYFF